MTNCIFPLCQRIVERNEFCFLHAKHFAEAKEKKMPIKTVKEIVEKKLQKQVDLKLRVPLELPKLLAKAAKIFNQYIRNRDKDKGCVSCHSPKTDHASHFYAAGKYTALRFNEDNVSGSCVRCNTWLHGNLLEYRMRLLGRIGEQRMQMLESMASRKKTHKWERLELEQIIKIYKAKIASQEKTADTN